MQNLKNISDLENLYWLRERLKIKLNEGEFHDLDWIARVEEKILKLERSMKLNKLKIKVGNESR